MVQTNNESGITLPPEISRPTLTMKTFPQT